MFRRLVGVWGWFRRRFRSLPPAPPSLLACDHQVLKIPLFSRDGRWQSCGCPAAHWFLREYDGCLVPVCSRHFSLWILHGWHSVSWDEALVAQVMFS